VNRFEEKVAVITGGGAGAGRTYADRFCAEGASVVIVDIDGDAAERAVDELRSTGARAIGVQMDIVDEAAASDMADRAVEEFGGIDILINNAAVHLHHGNPPFTKEDLPQWKRVLDVNTFGALNCIAACRAPMQARGGGVIVNQSSAGAWQLNSAYSISKLGLNAVTAVLSRELAPDGIRVVGVGPGFIGSPNALEEFGQEVVGRIIQRQQVKRLMTTDDLASVVMFLCSDEASFISGTTIPVDSGGIRKAW
jgi:NAD(P)-dependent dehydrogenase (short-subunit alcohol dehydrogenase family)